VNGQAAGETLPLSWYVDPQVLAAERATVFVTAPEPVGCLPQVPEHGSFRTVAGGDHAEALVRDGERVRLLSNVCRHRGMLMAEGSGRRKALVCPMHRWSYGLDGRLLKAPHYPETPCLRLPARELQVWNGICFAGRCSVADDLAPLAERDDLDVGRYVFHGAEVERQPVNWKIPAELLLENYHAAYIHPGFARFVRPSTWTDNEGAFDSERFLCQEMKPHPDFTRNGASPVFARWQRAILEVTGGELPPFGLLSGLYFPNVILEWWPFSFVLTAYHPRAPEQTLMTREYYFDPRALAAVPDYAEIAKAAIVETQKGDDEGHEALQRGRALRHRVDPEGLGGCGTYQSPMEDSVAFFHSLLLRDVAPLLERDARRAG
jgi:phenylpropionate dioxygenase-like ring-hydroxylating dioxygenase large terminal subunit